MECQIQVASGSIDSSGGCDFSTSDVGKAFLGTRPLQKVPTVDFFVSPKFSIA